MGNYLPRAPEITSRSEENSGEVNLPTSVVCHAFRKDPLDRSIPKVRRSECALAADFDERLGLKMKQRRSGRRTKCGVTQSAVKHG